MRGDSRLTHMVTKRGVRHVVHRGHEFVKNMVEGCGDTRSLHLLQVLELGRGVQVLCLSCGGLALPLGAHFGRVEVDGGQICQLLYV